MTAGSPPGGYGPPPGGGGYGPPPGGGGYGPPAGGGGFTPPPTGGYGPPGGPPGGYGAPPGGYPPGGGGYNGPPQGFGPPGLHQGNNSGGSGLKTAAIVLICVGALFFVAGLVPCLGWVNWLGVPTNVVPIVLGILGLTNKNKNPDGSTPDSGVFIAAVIVGTVGVLGGSLRCVLGGGVL